MPEPAASAVPLPRPGVNGDCAARLGLDLPRQLSYQRWLNIGRQLAAAASSSAWCLGDWLVFGERQFEGRYRSAIEQTSLEYKTLRNYAWVARKFSISRRHHNLSFGHHAEVAGLPEPEQDFWLRKAGVLGWSRNLLRHEVQSSLRERAVELAGPPAGPGDLAIPPVDDPALTEKLQVTVTTDQLQVIQQAATLAQLSVATWALMVLERAARTALATEPELAGAIQTRGSMKFGIGVPAGAAGHGRERR